MVTEYNAKVRAVGYGLVHQIKIEDYRVSGSTAIRMIQQGLLGEITIEGVKVTFVVDKSEKYPHASIQFAVPDGTRSAAIGTIICEARKHLVDEHEKYTKFRAYMKIHEEESKS